MNDYPVNNTFSPKAPGEVVALSFNFSNLGPIFSSATVAVASLQGVSDPAAASMVVGSPVVVDNIATVAVRDGLHNADYLVTCTGTSGILQYILSGVLPVRNAVGEYSQSEILD